MSDTHDLNGRLSKCVCLLVVLVFLAVLVAVVHIWRGLTQ